MDQEGSPQLRPTLVLIAAMDQRQLIATSHGIPWKLPRDVARFRARTTNQWLLLGRKTYQEMLGWFKPGHHPLVLTRDLHWKPETGEVVHTIEEALVKTKAAARTELWCCGGAQVFASALPYADVLDLTLISTEYPADAGAAYFPDWSTNQFQQTERTNCEPDQAHDAPFAFTRWERVKAPKIS